MENVDYRSRGRCRPYYLGDVSRRSEDGAPSANFSRGLDGGRAAGDLVVLVSRAPTVAIPTAGMLT